MSALSTQLIVSGPLPKRAEATSAKARPASSQHYVLRHNGDSALNKLPNSDGVGWFEEIYLCTNCCFPKQQTLIPSVQRVRPETPMLDLRYMAT